MKRFLLIFVMAAFFFVELFACLSHAGGFVPMGGTGGGGTVSSVPAAPTGVSATAGNTQNTVRFTASSGSTSCNLYWKSGSSMSGNCTGNGTKVTGVTSPDVITSLTNGTTYYYMLTCQNAAGESNCSAEVSATPSAPTPTKQGGYSGTLTASSIGLTGASGGTDTIMQNYSLTASTITEAKIENYYATWSGNGTTAWIRFKVWRLSGGVYTLIGTTPEISMQTTNGLQTYTFTGIACQTGDLIGFSTNAGGSTSPYGAVDALGGSGTWYSKVGDITSGTVAQSDMTALTTYSNMQIQFWGN